MENNEKYWLHRISHEWEVSYPLLDKGYLSLGWSGFANTTILEDARKDDNFQSFEKTYNSVAKQKFRSRWSMWYFARFQIGDTVVVPLWNGEFSIYRVIELAKPIKAIKDEVLTLTDKNGKQIEWNQSGSLLHRSFDNHDIELGFVIKVEPVYLHISRADYADSSLTSRMKMRTTNGDISDLKDNIKKTIEAVQNQKPINFYEVALNDGAKILLKNMNELLDDRKLEQLVKVFFEKIGADNVYIPPKNEQGKSDNADADVIAVFKMLKIIIMVQVKKHQGITDDWAVKQITKYKEQVDDPKSELSIDEDGNDYTSTTWVVSTCDCFSEMATSEAKGKVRLINGEEFAKMIMDAGLSNLVI